MVRVSGIEVPCHNYQKAPPKDLEEMYGAASIAALSVNNEEALLIETLEGWSSNV